MGNTPEDKGQGREKCFALRAEKNLKNLSPCSFATPFVIFSQSDCFTFYVSLPFFSSYRVNPVSISHINSTFFKAVRSGVRIPVETRDFYALENV